MTTDSRAAAPPTTGRFPSQVRFILGNEAAERYSFYGVKGILALYITNTLLMSEDAATNIIHLFTFVNYFMPLLGAWVSDRHWGRYRTILWVSLSYCAGHGMLACGDAFASIPGKTWCLGIGLGLIAFGSGGIKPCVSAFMGDQFPPEGRHLLPRAYAAFYWCVNLGSTAALLSIPWIRKHHGYGWAFGVPGIAMALATLIFWLGTRHYVMVPPSARTRTAGFFSVFRHAFRERRSRAAGTGFWDPARTRFADAEVDAARSVGPILSIFALIPVFWALFDQTFSTWVLQGASMRPCPLGPLTLPTPDGLLAWLKGTAGSPLSEVSYTIGPEEMLAANPILVMILVPVMTFVVYPLAGRLATPLRRMATGMFIAATSYLIVAWIQVQLEAGRELSVLWQAIPYVVLTTAEVLISTTGLEFAFREAAATMKSAIMGFWNVTVALGNLIVIGVTWTAGRLSGQAAAGHDVAVTSKMFLFYAVLTFVVAILFSVIASRYRYRDPEAALGR